MLQKSFKGNQCGEEKKKLKIAAEINKRQLQKTFL